MAKYRNRFKDQVDTRKRIRSKIKVNKKNRCWEWQGTKGQDGYGRISYKGKTRQAHRLSFEVFKGITPPEGKVVRHMCNNRICVNPDHLELGTWSDNRKDTVKRLGGSPSIRGEKHFNAKLNEDTVRFIREEYEKDQFGHSKSEFCRVIAGDCGVSPYTIMDVINGITWKDI